MNLGLRIPKPATIVSKLRGSGKEATSSITMDEVDAVCRQYDWQHWRVVAILGGSNSTNLLLETDRGKQVLKRYHWSLPSTQQEHSILHHLEAVNFPTPRLRLNRTGESCTMVGEEHYAIYEYLEGYELHHYLMLQRSKMRAVSHAGETLARFHLAMDGFVPDGRKFNGYHPESARLWRGQEWHLDILNRFRDATTPGSDSPQLTRFLRSIAADLSTLLHSAGDLFDPVDPALPRVVIHGDYAPHNVLYENARVKSVLDLGDACVNLRALDLARGVATFARAGTDEINLPIARAFIDAYQQLHTIHDKEIEMLNSLLQWRYAQNILWKLEDADPADPSIDRHLDATRRKWQSIRRLQETRQVWHKLRS